MQVREIMTSNPACCLPGSSLQEVAKMMVDCDCGEIPVVDEQNRPVGVVTDRDIATRAVAQGMDVCSATAGSVMSTPVLTVTPQDSLESVRRVMEENQVRRVPVVDTDGACCGIVAQADIARHAAESETGDLVRDVSRATSPSARGH
jgi:CBS domain-containing protein